MTCGRYLRTKAIEDLKVAVAVLQEGLDRNCSKEMFACTLRQFCFGHWKRTQSIEAENMFLGVLKRELFLDSRSWDAQLGLAQLLTFRYQRTRSKEDWQEACTAVQDLLHIATSNSENRALASAIELNLLSMKFQPAGWLDAEDDTGPSVEEFHTASLRLEKIAYDLSIDSVVKADLLDMVGLKFFYIKCCAIVSRVRSRT